MPPVISYLGRVREPASDLRELLAVREDLGTLVRLLLAVHDLVGEGAVRGGHGGDLDGLARVSEPGDDLAHLLGRLQSLSAVVGVLLGLLLHR